jgi:hypothetical protein
MKTVVWFSRHDILPSQVTELKRLFGEDVNIVQDSARVANADDMIHRYHEHGGDEMLVVAPLSVIDQLCKRGYHPLWAEMKEVPLSESETVANGRGFRFVKFRRVKRLALEFEEI